MIREVSACKQCGKPAVKTGKKGPYPKYCNPNCGERYRRIHNPNVMARIKEWQAKNSGKLKEYARKRHIENGEADQLRKYGLTVHEYAKMLLAQCGVCAICGGGPTGPGKRLVVDHCHSSGRVRALLCSRCNTGIGLLGDDPMRCEVAADYLRQHSTRVLEAA